MWLADELHLSWPKARIMIYGYESAIMGTESVQDLHDIAMVFKDRLVSIRESTKVGNFFLFLVSNLDIC
jgi:hypothetical protein